MMFHEYSALRKNRFDTALYAKTGKHHGHVAQFTYESESSNPAGDVLEKIRSFSTRLREPEQGERLRSEALRLSSLKLTVPKLLSGNVRYNTNR